jgi:hypothetical protein
MNSSQIFKKLTMLPHFMCPWILGSYKQTWNITLWNLMHPIMRRVDTSFHVYNYKVMCIESKVSLNHHRGSNCIIWILQGYVSVVKFFIPKTNIGLYIKLPSIYLPNTGINPFHYFYNDESPNVFGFKGHLMNQHVLPPCFIQE